MSIAERMDRIRDAMREAGDLGEEEEECDEDGDIWEDFGNWHDAPVFTSKIER